MKLAAGVLLVRGACMAQVSAIHGGGTLAVVENRCPISLRLAGIDVPELDRPFSMTGKD